MTPTHISAAAATDRVGRPGTDDKTEDETVLVNRDGKKESKKEGCNTRTSQGITHPNTTLAQARLTAEF